MVLNGCFAFFSEAIGITQEHFDHCIVQCERRFLVLCCDLFSDIVLFGKAVAGLIRIIVPLVESNTATDVYYWAIFASQAVASLPNALLASLPAEISAHWFGEKVRRHSCKFVVG